MAGHATRFHPANPATEHTPVGCGEESPRSCRRVRRNTDGRECGRPRPHQRDDRPYDPFGSRKCGARTFTGWGCTNNVSVPISASEGFLRTLRQPPIRTRGDLRATPLSLSKTQTTCLSPYLPSCWMCQGGRQRVLNQFILPSALSLPLPPTLEAEAPAGRFQASKSRSGDG
ncbi:MAG: hypothetical protein GX456_04375 [Verrucomicrobia bacterium]|nr:hypothetical protein [Verrucomicrobiota bacterium]